MNYVNSTSTAGGTTPATATYNPNSPVVPTTTTTPVTTTPFYGNGGAGGLTPGMTPNIPDTDNSKASRAFMSPRNLMTTSFVLVLSITTLKPMYTFFCWAQERGPRGEEEACKFWLVGNSPVFYYLPSFCQIVFDIIAWTLLVTSFKLVGWEKGISFSLAKIRARVYSWPQLCSKPKLCSRSKFNLIL